MKDSFGRTIDYLRISVTDRCNLRCLFCLPEEGVPLLRHEDILRLEEILFVVKEMAHRGIRKVRLTGGEPLLRRGILELIEKLREIEEIEDLTLTTNGTKLKEFARPLKEAGIKRINIGIPSFNEENYKLITRQGELRYALEGLEEALKVGFSPLKVNTVLLPDLNDDPLPYLEFIQEYPVEVRFIEYMPIGSLAQEGFFLPAEEFLNKIKNMAKIEEADPPYGNGPARKHYRIKGGKGSFSFISAMSDHFCPACNRIRLMSDGHLRPCLFGDEEVDLIPALRPNLNPQELGRRIDLALETKPKERKKQANGRFMAQIGG